MAQPSTIMNLISQTVDPFDHTYTGPLFVASVYSSEEGLEDVGFFKTREAAQAAIATLPRGRVHEADTREFIAEAIREAFQCEPEPCGAFALCDRQATTYRSHPVIGRVACCDRCAGRLADLNRNAERCAS